MPSTTEEIAQKLVAYLGENANVAAIDALYDDAIETVEADPVRTRSGKATVRASMQGFADTHSFRYTHISEPLVSGSNFALHLRFEATNTASGQGFAVDEIGVYTVKEGHIVREQFFYDV
ncbi:MAG: nuclear transport factor 2 family protein [Armatimonadetes bacterium]|nr:nuclear transport factor 2 family protein [Armatimonadota bacterium]